MPHPEATLAVLAGGRGSRMGIPKSQLMLRGKPILVDLLDRLDWQGPTMLVTAPACRHPPGSDRFDLELADPLDDQGPLLGMRTALAGASTDVVAFVPVDMPHLAREQIDWMLDHLDTALGLMCQRDGQIEPLPCILRRAMLPGIDARLSEQRRSVHSLVKEPGMKTLPAPAEWGPKIWTNLNTPEDLQSLT